MSATLLFILTSENQKTTQMKGVRLMMYHCGDVSKSFMYVYEGEEGKG